MRVKITFYGRLGELIAREVDLDVPGPITVIDLIRRLAQSYSNAAESLLHPRVRAVVRDQVVPQDFVVGPGDQLEILPIVSGG